MDDDIAVGDIVDCGDATIHDAAIGGIVIHCSIFYYFCTICNISLRFFRLLLRFFRLFNRSFRKTFRSFRNRRFMKPKHVASIVVLDEKSFLNQLFNGTVITVFLDSPLGTINSA